MKVIDLPQVHQIYGYDCGSAALQAILMYYGVEVYERDLIKEVKTTRKGTALKNILKTIKRYKLRYTAKPMTLKDLKKYIDKRIPVIIVLQAWTNKKQPDWENDWVDGHYVVAIGYKPDKILFEDPSSFKRTFLKYDELEKRWHDIGVDGKIYIHYGVAVYGRKPKIDKYKAIHMD